MEENREDQNNQEFQQASPEQTPIDEPKHRSDFPNPNSEPYAIEPKKKSKKRTVIIIVAVSIVSVFILICVTNFAKDLVLEYPSEPEPTIMTEEEIKSGAELYLKKKYGQDFKVSFTGSAHDQCLMLGCSPMKAGTLIYTDGPIVHYNGEFFSDDYQSQEIIDEVEKNILNPVFEQLKPYRIHDEEIGKVYEDIEESTYERIFKSSFPSLYAIVGEGGIISDNSSDTNIFFREKYNGNIEDFCQREGMRLGGPTLIMLSENGEDWESRVNIFDKMMSTCFRGDKNHHYVALSPEAYENSKSSSRVHAIDGSYDSIDKGIYEYCTKNNGIGCYKTK